MAKLFRTKMFRSRVVLLGVIGLAVITIAVSLTAVAKVSAEAFGMPRTPHTIAGRTDCLQCHRTGSIRPFPDNHSGREISTCLTCHPVAENAGPGLDPGTTRLNDKDGYCLGCHSKPTLSMKLANGEDLSLFVNTDVYMRSIHGGKLACTDCHRLTSTYPHLTPPAASLRDFQVTRYEACKRCHFANYTKTLDSVHFQSLSNGNAQAPICTDCHGAHNVVLPDEPKSKISTACGTCHKAVFDNYAKSVHGRSLLDEENRDVPVCTSCHGVHNIHDPAAAAFKLDSVKMCSECHSNDKLMGKYGISTNVLSTYLEDFHGKSVSFYGQQSRDIVGNKPVCTDCHGVHDIKGAAEPDSPIKANLLNTCQKCHPDATENFPSAWLSHYEPSLEKASLVYYIRVYYWVLIPFMIGGLVLHMTLDLWRLARNR